MFVSTQQFNCMALCHHNKPEDSEDSSITQTDKELQIHHNSKDIKQGP